MWLCRNHRSSYRPAISLNFWVAEKSLPSMSLESRNIKLVIGFDGTEFSGWQRQKNNRTIQGEIERCLSRMTQEDILVNGAGRTDAGVHADGMVAHFHTRSTITCQDFLFALNAMLPSAIRIFSSEEVPLAFHARFSAIGKIYRYEVCTDKIQPPRMRLYSLHITVPLDRIVMSRCLSLIVGTHDFSSFENSGSRDKNNSSGRGATRTIHEARLIEHSNEYFSMQFQGDGFLRNMIRNLTGSLLMAGKGKITPREFAQILAAKDRTMAGPTAPAHGLSLVKVLY
jgi:tRNA pseudouridine38-40 synthase